MEQQQQQAERERKGGKSLIITWTQFARDDLILSWERQQTISSSLMCSTRCCCCRAARESCSEKRRNRFSYTQELRTKCKMRKSHKSNEGKEGEKNCGASEDDRRRPTTVKSSTQKSLRRKRKMNHVFLRNFARHLPSFALLFFLNIKFSSTSLQLQVFLMSRRRQSTMTTSSQTACECREIGWAEWSRRVTDFSFNSFPYASFSALFLELGISLNWNCMSTWTWLWAQLRTRHGAHHIGRWFWWLCLASSASYSVSHTNSTSQRRCCAFNISRFQCRTRSSRSR